MADFTSPPASPPPASTTARGDRVGRRRDVLSAAREILDEVGWAGFSIRAIAARAGVSTGAVYQWFSGKEEIFAEIYDQEVRAGIARIEALPSDLPLVDAVRTVIDWVVDLHARLGRYQLEFVGGSVEREGYVEPILIASYQRLGRKVDEMLDRAASHDGVRLVEGEFRTSWFWAGCVGTAQRLIVLPHHFAGESRERFLQFSAESLSRSLQP